MPIMSEGRNKTKQNFTSYVNQVPEENFVNDDYKPKLLSGELEAARANNVCMYIASYLKDGKVFGEKTGILLITNFRLSFVSLDMDDEQLSFQSNRFLGSSEVSLSNIDRIYQYVDKKKRIISPQFKNSSKIDKIRIVCKNFKTFTFGFQLSEIGKGKYIADALVKFAFPARHNLSFLYRFKEKYYRSPMSEGVKMYDKKLDWFQELERCNATGGWRVYSKDCRVSNSSLPMHFVVPKHLSDIDYDNISKSFRNNRSAIWVWGFNDAALVRLAELNPDITNTTVENILLEHVRRCDPQKRQPRLLELYKILPSIQDVNLSYIKLRDLCTPDSDQQFMAQDGRFYTLLEKSYWLLYVSLCLKHSNIAAKLLREGQTVVLQEINGRDMSCVISSLVQLLMDSSYRTIQGFQNLIQKEWVILGHPFSDRLGHVSTVKITERSPLFLLFLDCTWQLLQQFPEAFEFSDVFLTTVWDSLFLPIFDTFQFNSETERYQALNAEHVVLRPVWDWEKQFDTKDLALFTNPLYRAKWQHFAHYSTNSSPSSTQIPIASSLFGTRQGDESNGHSVLNGADKLQLLKNDERFLEPQCCLRDIELWQQCYFRWIPHLEVKHGGIAQTDLLNRLLANNIYKLRQKLGQSVTPDASSEHVDVLEQILSTMIIQTRDPDAASDASFVIGSFFPFSSIVPTAQAVCTELLIASNDINFSHDSMYETSSLND
ncbi:myotubularin-related protein 10-B [Anopheles maculipalpis]|uniref:myotubularin-related protein 10-B n=1 Tax=Anopheles maculipalpis TaxID=1496333 RepID=UPI002158CE16|nr:myotubularin-related protein 10-B [Anopheles maculipalpis]